MVWLPLRNPMCYFQKKTPSTLCSTRRSIVLLAHSALAGGSSSSETLGWEETAVPGLMSPESKPVVSAARLWHLLCG